MIDPPKTEGHYRSTREEYKVGIAGQLEEYKVGIAGQLRYFEAFFDSMDFYHEMVRDEIEAAREDVAELYGMVASNRSDAGNPGRLQKITDLRCHPSFRRPLAGQRLGYRRIIAAISTVSAQLG